MPNIILKRDSGWADGVRKYKILLDGNVLCKIADGETLTLPIEAGQHTIKVKIDWCGSKVINFTVQEKNVVFDIASNLRGAKVFMAILYGFMPSKWVNLTLNSSLDI